MSYNKMMKWNKKRPKGTKQTVIAHTDSGFWPSCSFIDKWIRYTERCEAAGQVSLSCEEYYKAQLNRMPTI